MTQEERDTLDLGCVGVTLLELGRSRRPPMNLAFGDARAQRTIAPREERLARGEIASKAVVNYQRELRKARRKLEEARAAGNDRDADSALKYVKAYETSLERARAEATVVWSRISKEQRGEAEKSRQEAKIEGDQRTFDRVLGHAAKFEEIIAAGPVDKSDFIRRVNADPELSALKNVFHELPSGNPSDWEVVVYSKHFWSGQELTHDVNGNLVFDADGNVTFNSTDTPNPDGFKPDPSTGQVDMARDQSQPKPGFVNFDYGFFDPHTGNWWHANNGEFERSGAADEDLPEQFEHVLRQLPGLRQLGDLYRLRGQIGGVIGYVAGFRSAQTRTRQFRLRAVRSAGQAIGGMRITERPMIRTTRCSYIRARRKSSSAATRTSTAR
ncbi:hypothetical protein [Nocardia sp. NPDC050710]|uniref:hypothetical protein n=1 Tax=Nocardia sp. NPDC050710 TaxID=3157220 RepID=UPI003407AFAC